MALWININGRILFSTAQKKQVDSSVEIGQKRDMSENLPIILVYYQHIDFHITDIIASYLMQSLVLQYRLLMKTTSSPYESTIMVLENFWFFKANIWLLWRLFRNMQNGVKKQKSSLSEFFFTSRHLKQNVNYHKNV